MCFWQLFLQLIIVFHISILMVFGRHKYSWFYIFLVDYNFNLKNLSNIFFCLEFYFCINITVFYLACYLHNLFYHPLYVESFIWNKIFYSNNLKSQIELKGPYMYIFNSTLITPSSLQKQLLQSVPNLTVLLFNLKFLNNWNSLFVHLFQTLTIHSLLFSLLIPFLPFSSFSQYYYYISILSHVCSLFSLL